MNQEPFLLNPKNLDFVHGRGPKAPAMAYGCITLFCAVFLLIGIPFFGFVGREWYIWGTLRSSGVEVQATVTNLARHQGSRGKSSTYSLGYQFEAPGPDGAQTYANDHQIDGNDYNHLKVGGPVAVKYARDNPALSRTVNAPWQRPGPLFAMSGFLMLWTAFPLGVLIATLRGRSRERRRIAGGTVVVGRVTGVKATTISGGKDRLEIDYVFTLPNGQVQQAKEKRDRMRTDSREIPEIGAGVRVLVLDGSNYELL